MKWQAFRLCALWCWHQLLTLGLILLVLMAVMVEVSRQLLPLADNYRANVEAALSERLGLPVRMSRLEGEREGLNLRFRLLRLELRDPKATTVLLRIPEVELRPALWQSLWHWEPRVDVRLRGLDIHLDQQPDGNLQVRELAGLAQRDTGAAQQALRFALRQPTLALRESRIGLSLQKSPELSFSGVDFINRNDGDQHVLAGRLRLAGGNQELGLHMELAGDPLNWQQSDLRTWVHLPVLPLDAWLPGINGAGQGISRLTGGGDYWLHFQQGRLTSAQAQLDWRDVVLYSAYGRHHLQNMHGLLSWQRNPAGWQLAGQELRGRIDDLPWPLPVLALRQGNEALTLATAHARVAEVARLLDSLPLPENLATWLREAAPAGDLRLRADLVSDGAGSWQPRHIDAEGETLALHASGRYPGGHNLSGWLRWTPDQAWLGLDSHGAELDLPHYFREPATVSDLQGHLRLSRQSEGWRLDSDRLHLVNADASGSAVLSVAIPQDDRGAARLSLLGGMVEARAASAWRYVPWPLAGDHVLDWLRRSLLGGTVHRGDFLYEGPLFSRHDLPPPRLLMRFALAGGRLDYTPGWPELRDMDGVITLDRHRLEITGSSAHMLESSRGQALHAVIADLEEPVLEVSADLAGSGPDVMRLFRESPLQKHTAGLPDILALTGPLSAHLQLGLPLRGGQAQVEVVTQLQGNELQLKPARLTVSQLRGEVRYSTAGGLQSPGLDGQLLEAPVSATIQSRMRGEDHLDEINVNVAGTISIPALRRWLGSDLLEVASGSTPYQVRVSLPTGGAPRLQVDSTLAGLHLNLPSPLGKETREVVPLRYQTTLGSGEQMARLQYGQRLSGGLVWDGSRLDRALLRVDSNSVAWPQRHGIEIEGRLARLDLSEWRPWLTHFGHQNDDASTVAARGETPLPSLTRLDMEARELLAEGWRLRNVRLDLGRETAAWRLGVASEELEGTVRLPDAPGGEIGVSFSRLQWPLPAAAHAPPSADGLNPVAGLGNRPLLVQGEGLRLAALPALGSMSLGARLLPSPYGLRIENIALQGPLLDFNGRLDWQWRGGVSTRLRGKVASSNVAGLLAALGYAPNLVSRNASAEMDLGWHGAPDKPSPAALEGQLKVLIEDGRLLNISAGTSASRVFGWFNLDNIRRRLRGDFSDVLRRGLSFDTASLEGSLQGGVMPSAHLLVDGPTLKAEGRGRLDIGQRQVDQEFNVTVPVTSAVPIAAVVMAGPLVGGAVAAAQLAFEKQLDKATQLHYHVSGDWANPRIESRNTKNSGKKVDRDSATQPDTASTMPGQEGN